MAINKLKLALLSFSKPEASCALDLEGHPPSFSLSVAQTLSRANDDDDDNNNNNSESRCPSSTNHLTSAINADLKPWPESPSARLEKQLAQTGDAVARLGLVLTRAVMSPTRDEERFEAARAESLLLGGSRMLLAVVNVGSQWCVPLFFLAFRSSSARHASGLMRCDALGRLIWNSRSRTHPLSISLGDSICFWLPVGGLFPDDAPLFLDPGAHINSGFSLPTPTPTPSSRLLGGT